MILFDDDERYMDNANTAPGVFSAGVNSEKCDCFLKSFVV